MRLGVFLALSVIWPLAAPAQDWATRAYCETGPRPVTASDFAPHDLVALEAEAAAIPNGRGKFWRIESPEGAVSHLWGTYHVSAPAILDLPSIVRDRISEARVLALEVDYTLPDREAVLDQFNEPGRFRDPGDPFMMPGPLDLTYLGAAGETWIIDRLNGYGTTEDALFALSYAGLAAVLLADPCEDYFTGSIPVQDDFIQTLARIGGAEIVGLEDPVEFFTDLSQDEETAKALVAVYASYLEPPRDTGSRAAMFQLYLEGRLGLLAAWDNAFVTRALGRYGETALDLTNGYLVEFRNRRFLDRLSTLLAEGGTFIAVGAAHLPGETGLVNLLEENGYVMNRIMLPGETE